LVGFEPTPTMTLVLQRKRRTSGPKARDRRPDDKPALAYRINGPYWDIPAELEQPIVERLIHLGYSVALRDDWHFY
jgi:hypothetical protein